MITKDDINSREYRFDKIQEAYKFISSKLSIDDVQDECIKYLSEFRQIDYNILRSTGVFYAEDNNELDFITSFDEDFQYYLGFKKKDVSLENRYLFPIFSGNGNLLAWVGYDYESKSKYLVNMLGLGDKKRLLYGMHDIKQAFEEDTIIVTEGIFERIRLKSIGLNVCVSLLGKKMSPWQKRYLNRFKNKILIPDGDSSGQEMIDQWKEDLTGNVGVIKLIPKEKEFIYPEERITKVAKDIDDFLRDDPEKCSEFKDLYNYIKDSLNSSSSLLTVNF